MFITLEGPEGSGKTSHLPHLVEFLRSKGHTVFPTREPGGTSIGEQIREVLHSLKNAEMNPRTETLLYQAARAQFVEQVVRAAAAGGRDRAFRPLRRLNPGIPGLWPPAGPGTGAGIDPLRHRRPGTGPDRAAGPGRGDRAAAGHPAPGRRR